MTNNVVGVQPNEIAELDDSLDQMVGDIFFSGTAKKPRFFMLIELYSQHWLVNIHTGKITKGIGTTEDFYGYTRTTYEQMELS